MNLFFQIIGYSILASGSIVFIMFVIDEFVKHSKAGSKLKKWWEKHIVKELDPNDPNF